MTKWGRAGGLPGAPTCLLALCTRYDTPAVGLACNHDLECQLDLQHKFRHGDYDCLAQTLAWHQVRRSAVNLACNHETSLNRAK